MRRFVREYRKDRDPQAAALRAGYSDKNLNSTPAQLLRHPDVRAAIARWDEQEAILGLITKEMIRGELSKIAFAPLGGEVKASEKTRALELLGKDAGMFKPTTFDRPTNEKPLTNRQAKDAIIAAADPVPEAGPISPLAALMGGMKH